MSHDIKGQFKQWNTEAKAVLKEANDKVNAIVEPIQRDLQLNVLDDIATHFGNFLNDSLGDRVTGQRSSVLNQTYLDINPTGKQVVISAAENNMSVEEYLAQKDFHTDWNGGKIYNKTQAYISAGRAFGVSYWTGEGDRMHTCYFEPQALFMYLTQQHVDCIKDKEKKACVQAFLNYRNAMKAEMDAEKISEFVIEADIPVRAAIMSMVHTNPRYSIGYQRNNAKNVMILDEIVDRTITHVALVCPKMDLWNMHSNVTTHARSDKMIPWISVQFGTSEKNEGSIMYGNVDITCFAVEGYKHSLQRAMDEDDSYITNHRDPINNEHRCFDSLVKNEKTTFSRNGLTADCICLDFDKVLQNKQVAEAIEKRINFFKDYSKKLQELKHEFAALFFVHSH